MKIKYESEGLAHIHNIMHVFIEGLAAGVYDSVDDIQQDAIEYLSMEKAVQKLSRWKPTDNVEDLATIFDGISNSIQKKREKEEENQKWDEIKSMPTSEDLKGELSKYFKAGED